MAVYTMRCNLSAANFPLVVDFMGRSIIVPQYDQNYEKTLVSAADADKDRGIPQVYYMHNVMPTAQGFQSVGFTTKIAGIPGNADFDKAFPILNTDNNRFLFVPAVGTNYIYSAVPETWASVPPVIPAGTFPDDILVTTAYVNGETYIFYAGYGCFTYDAATNMLVPVTLTGLTIPDILGVCSSNGYLIAFTKNAIAWSSASDPTDFVPDLATGAGGGNVTDIKGNIIVCLPIINGFIIYTEKNAVSASYTGNISLPFFTKEVSGSGGIESPEQVSWTSNLSEHFVYSTVGLQQLDKVGAKNVYPEATDFLAAQVFEDFDEVSNTFTLQYTAQQIYTALTVIGDRFLVISYGLLSPDFTHAIVLDLLLKRWGKLKIAHRDCFQYNEPNKFGELTYDGLGSFTYEDLGTSTYDDLNSRISQVDKQKKSIAFLQADGTVQIVTFNLGDFTANGVFVLGKFQFHRSVTITHQVTEIETIDPAINNFTMHLLPTLDGKTFEAPVSPVILPVSVGSKVKKYAKRVSGLNVTQLFKGAFNFTTIILEFTLGGHR